MKATAILASPPPTDDWGVFPGGELEGKRPRALCPACRERLRRAAASGAPVHRRRPVCFQCYRVELDRERAFEVAGRVDTASDARFQFALPFEPVNRARLEMLRVERAAARASAASGGGQFADRRRRAQVAARHALQALAIAPTVAEMAPSARERMMAAAVRMAELQLPESWLPFVVAR